MNILKQRPTTYMGMEIITSIYMTKTIEDWSKVRSPSRAKRRRKLGKRQNIVNREIPSEDVLVVDNSKIIMHPETYTNLVLKRKDENYASFN